MPVSTVLIIVGLALFVFGVAKLSSGQSGGFSLSNFGINIGSTQSPTYTVSGSTPQAPKTDWIGLATASIGLATAIVGWLKA